MEYLLYIFLGVCGFAYLVFRFNEDKNKHPLPPGTMGWPLIGETFELQRFSIAGKPYEFHKKRVRKYNTDIFKTCIIGEKSIILWGLAGNKLIFTSEKTLMLTWWHDTLKKLFGTSFFTAPYDEAVRTRKIVTAFLQQEVMHQLVERFDKTCRKCMQRDWIGNNKVLAFSLIKKYAFSIACDMFTSVDDSEWETKMMKEFNILLGGVFQLPIYFPGTRHYKAVRSADLIREELIKLIKKKRMIRDLEGTTDKDLISYLIDAHGENGNVLSDTEIADNVILLMNAGHDTSTSSMMMLMKYLAEMPDCYYKVLQEQREIAMQKKPGELLNKDDIHKMKYSWNVIKEVLRLSPPIVGTFRKSKVDFTYNGYTVPKGWVVSWITYSTHKDARYFQDPEKFDPVRFDRDKLTPYTFVPFGGGPRMCPGNEFAKLEMLVFLHHLVREFRWELEFPNEIIAVDPMPKSSKGLPVYLYKHQ
ncbi:Cytochrome p450 [Thalictrum thalictroides]|uniref:Cytochrome p450 n=1 Tax=Thalictrum thalictroides TaxID=46969 RepID=A0A7J6UWQ1_THATH|nr:Cytochrome p450 [Thalictrum thalictroides]